MKKIVPSLLLMSSTLCATAGSWEGFYAGFNADYFASGNHAAKTQSDVIQYCSPEGGCDGGQIVSSAAARGATLALSLKKSGAIGGAQVGYNRAFRARYLWGFETDLQTGGDHRADQGSTSVDYGGDPLVPNTILTQLNLSKSTTYLGTVRGRIGYFLSPSLLLAGTGGLAYGGVHAKTNLSQSYAIPEDITDIATQWETAGTYSRARLGLVWGVHLEKLLPNHWSLKSEYLYYNLGKATYRSGDLVDLITVPNTPQDFFTNSLKTTTRFDGHMVRLTLNYHFT